MHRFLGLGPVHNLILPQLRKCRKARELVVKRPLSNYDVL